MSSTTNRAFIALMSLYVIAINAVQVHHKKQVHHNNDFQLSQVVPAVDPVKEGLQGWEIALIVIGSLCGCCCLSFICCFGATAKAAFGMKDEMEKMEAQGFK